MRRHCFRLLNDSHGLWLRSTTPSQCRYLEQHRSCFSTVDVLKPHQAEVRVGSSGTIILDIQHPPRPTETNPVILYLPRGPSALEKTAQHSNLLSLGFDANASVVRVNYRSSAKHKFPTSLHDVLAAYDWVLTHVLPQTDTQDIRSDQVDSASIGICGELFGGTLATVLALTECRVGRKGVRAAAVGNPITDWTAMYAVSTGRSIDLLNKNEPDLQIDRKRASRKAFLKDSWTAFSANPTISSASLLRARFTLFAKPEHYFDPFASPLLFFRTASSDIPPERTFEDQFFDDEALLEFIKKRRAHRRHPPMGSDLVLPPMRVQIGEENLLRDQGRELVESIRRSIRSGARDSVEVTALRESSAAAGEERIEVVQSIGLGLWTENDLADIGMWFGRVLRSK